MPTPNVSIFASDGVAYAEVGASLELTCSVFVDPAIANNVTISVTWFQGTTLLLNGTDRVTITSGPNSQSTFTSILTVYPINTTDSDNFTCIAGVVPDSQLQPVTSSDLAEETVLVIVVEGKQFSLSLRN